MRPDFTTHLLYKRIPKGDNSVGTKSNSNGSFDNTEKPIRREHNSLTKKVIESYRASSLIVKDRVIKKLKLNY